MSAISPFTIVHNKPFITDMKPCNQGLFLYLHSPPLAIFHLGVHKGVHIETRRFYTPMKLTDKACKAAQGKNKTYKLADGGGMFLDVNNQTCFGYLKG